MRDENEGVRVGFEIAFKPVAGFEIEVIGGLVEKQQVGFFEQQFGERDAHLPAAGEGFDAALPVLFTEAEAGEDGADAGLDVIAVARGEFGLDVVVAVDNLLVFRAGVVEFAHAAFEDLLLGFERADLVEDGKAFVEDGTAGEVDAVLREIAGADPLHDVERAIVEALNSGERFEQGGLAGAVRADDADALLRGEEPVEVLKKNFGAEAFAGFGELNHGYWSAGCRRETGAITAIVPQGCICRGKKRRPVSSAGKARRGNGTAGLVSSESAAAETPGRSRAAEGEKPGGRFGSGARCGSRVRHWHGHRGGVDPGVHEGYVVETEVGRIVASEEHQTRGCAGRGKGAGVGGVAELVAESGEIERGLAVEERDQFGGIFVGLEVEAESVLFSGDGGDVLVEIRLLIHGPVNTGIAGASGTGVIEALARTLAEAGEDVGDEPVLRGPAGQVSGLKASVGENAGGPGLAGKAEGDRDGCKR